MSFSYSALSTALKCNKLYQYLYIDKLKPEEPESLNLHFGTAMHAALNAELMGTSGQETFDAYWESIRTLEFGQERYSYAEYPRMAEEFLRKFVKLHRPHLELLHGEQRLYGTLPGGTAVEGTPDLVARYKGAVVLIDFKTSAKRYHRFQVSCSDQLMLYAYLTEQQLAVKLEKIVYMVFVKGDDCTIQLQVRDLKEGEIHERVTNFERLISAVSYSGPDYPRNFASCITGERVCPFYTKCHSR